jgi:outer membrane protein assembly factor BamB
MRSSLLICALALCGLSFAQPQPTLLHGCGDLTGWAVNLSAKVPETKLEINRDPKFISEGQGSLHVATVSPKDAAGNTYLSVILTTPPVDMKGKALVFEAATTDPKITQALYVRGYDAKGQPALSWMNWAGPLKSEKTTFTLTPGISLGALQWEPGYLQTEDRSAIVKWEFYVGAHDPGVPFDLYLDNLRVAVSEVKSFMDAKTAHPLHPQTSLVEKGQAQVALYAPVGAEWKAVTDELAAALAKATGKQPPIVAGDAPEALQTPPSHAVLLGNVGNNRAMLYPYSHCMTTADANFPGAGGYELRTVSDPWGNKRNAIIIGASDVAGARAGVAAFTKALQGCVRGAEVILPRLFEIKPSAEAQSRFSGAYGTALDDKWLQAQKDRAERALESGAHTGLFGIIASVGDNYVLTGRDEYAKLFAWLCRRAKEHVDSKPTTFGGPWGMDSDFMGHRVMPLWGVVEQSPALTDQDRLEVSQVLFQYIREAALPEGAGAAGTAKAGHSVSNHGTFAALATFLAGEYFSKYYASAEGKQWVQLGDECFTNLARNFKAHEDCNGYQWLTNVHILRYALSKPDLTVFENDNARKMADYAIITMNNLGYQVPYGDTGEWKCWFSELPVLRMAEWFYRDGTYRWCVDKKLPLRSSYPLWEYDPGGAAVEPVRLAKFMPVGLDPHWYASAGGEKSGVSLEHAFDKIAFRDSFDPKGAYLLIDGLSNGGHRHMDGNSVLQWTENERVWIADADYIKSLPKYHNGVLILKDGQSAQIPDFVEVEHVADLPSVSAAVTTYRNYAGVDWRRNILWVKGRMFVVVDQMVAREPGDYSFRGIWQTVGNAKINGSAMDVEQGGQWARFATTAEARVLLDDDPLTGANWASYPYAGKPIVRVMQNVFNAKLAAGQRFNIFTVLDASGEQASTVKVSRAGDNLAVITGDGEPMMVGVPDRDGRVALPAEAQGQMAALLFTSQMGVAIGVKEAALFGGFQTYPNGADIEIDLTDGQAVVKSPAGATIGADQKVERVNSGIIAPADEVRSFIEMAAMMAPPVAPPGAGMAQVPALKPLWSYADKLDSYLLTNNPNTFEAVDAGLKLSCSPQPLAQNVFARDNTNTLDNLVDGALLTTDGGVMWDDNQQVTVELTLDNTYDLQRLALKAWFATTSSKNKLFQLGRLQAFASNDGFKQDNRPIADLTDTKTYGNWGEPAYGPPTYDFPLKGKARQVRLILTPRPGTAIYLSELQLWGNRPGLEIDLVAKQASGVPTHVFKALHTTDLNGDGASEVLAGSSNGMVYCFGADGKTLWKSDCGAPVNSVTTVDFAGDGKRAVVAGCMDSRLVAFDAQGKELWVFTPQFYKEAAHFRVVFPADLTGTGKQVAIGGADNWHFYAVDAQGQQLWRYESVHGSTSGMAADLDGDKKDEIIAGTEYYWWHVINPDGTRRFGYSVSGPTANAVAAGDVDGDGKQEVIFGGADTLVHVLTHEGKKLWTFNTGDEVQALQCADVNGDGKAEVLVGSLSFNVYCLDGTGKMLWRRDLGSPVRALALVKSGGKLLLAAGSEDGSVNVLDAASGQSVYVVAGKAEVLGLTPAQIPTGKPALVLSSGDGNLTVLAVP